MISLPLIKEIQVAGMTPHDLEQLVTQKLSTLIRDADVTVMVREIHSEKIYMIGALKKEGPIGMDGPLTVLQAISESGGFTDYAKRNKIYVLRMDHGKQERLAFDYGAVIRGSTRSKISSYSPAIAWCAAIAGTPSGTFWIVHNTKFWSLWKKSFSIARRVGANRQARVRAGGPSSRGA